MKPMVSLVCARCGTRLAPAMSGWRCPRMAACGFGGRSETPVPFPVAGYK